MKILILTASLLITSLCLQAQGLNIQETTAQKEGMTVRELFNERKSERKAKKQHKNKDTKNITIVKAIKIRSEDIV